MHIYTIGFTKKSAEEFFSLIREHDVRRLLDVRRNNTSQLAAFAKASKHGAGGDLGFFLRELCDAEYQHLPELAPETELLKAYRDQLCDWSEYTERYLQQITGDRVEERLDPTLFADSVLLCSEASPEHCHRRLAAEYLQRHWGDVEIIHL